MRILLLSDINSMHTRRWAIDLTKKGINVSIFTFVEPNDDWFIPYNIDVSTLGIKKRKKGGSTIISKLKYLYLIPKLKRKIKTFKPDIIHAHYLTSYGVLANYLNFHPLIISVWGSDVFYDLKNNRFLQKRMKLALKNADIVCSTSEIMRKTLLSYRKDIKVIPFGVDTEIFKPENNLSQKDKIIIGTIKTLYPIYGIDKLIKAFHEVNKIIPEKNLELHIYGDGPEKETYVELAGKLGISSKVRFYGWISNSSVPSALNSLDIFANLSDFESFGVSVLEASACALPIIATRTGGLTEVVLDNESGFLVEKEDINEVIEKLILLVNDQGLRLRMGKKGRDFVIEKYDINKTTQMMLDTYSSFF